MNATEEILKLTVSISMFRCRKHDSGISVDMKYRRIPVINYSSACGTQEYIEENFDKRNISISFFLEGKNINHYNNTPFSSYYKLNKYDNVDYIMAWIDSSGSMSDDQLRLCLAEVYTMALRKKPLKVITVQCDTKIQEIKEYRTVREMQRDFIGKKLFADGESTVMLSVVKKKEPSKETFQCDAISGATLTSNGVTEMIHECVAKYSAFLLDK